MRELKERNQGDIVLIPQRKKPDRVIPRPSLGEILVRAIGFFAARAVPLPGIAPFGIAFLALERRFSPQSLLTFGMVLTGYISLGNWYCLRYLGAAVAFMGLLLFAEHPRVFSTKTMVALASGVLLFFDAFSMLWSGFSAERLLILLLDPAMAALGILAFDRCGNLLSGKAFQAPSPSEEERMGLWILTGILLLSLQNLPGADWFSLANITGFLLLGMVAILGGMQSATLSGPLLGLLLGFGTDLLPCLALFGVCGLVCGLTCRFHKAAIAGSLALSGLILAWYAYGSHVPAIRYLEAPIAAGLLLLIPEGVFSRLRSFAIVTSPKTRGDDSCREQVQTKLALAAASFQTLADTFVRISDKDDKLNSQDIAALFDIAASHVCRTCPRVKDCWKRDFNATYKTLFQLLERLERKGVVRKLDVDPYFSEKCLKLDAFLAEINRLFEVYKINQVWKQKLCENRLLVGEQFSGVAEILSRLGEELSNLNESTRHTTEEIRCRLEKKSIRPEQITLNQGLDGRQSIRFSFPGAIKGDKAILLSILRQVLGKNFEETTPDSPGVLLFQEIPDLTIDAAFASSQMGEECGDSHLLNRLGSGKYIATLSDGMGTGHCANRESSATVSLLSAFMNAGFDKSVAVKLINSVMVMKSANEAFATVDLCMVDLYTGDAEFIKNGAEPSYIKRKSGTETVRSASLPVGVLSGVEVDAFAHHLSCGDTVVMVSDGLSLKESGGDWLRKTIDKASLNIPPQTLADEILAKALALKGGEADDDMTVLVLRLEKAS